MATWVVRSAAPHWPALAVPAALAVQGRATTPARRWAGPSQAAVAGPLVGLTRELGAAAGPLVGRTLELGAAPGPLVGRTLELGAAAGLQAVWVLTAMVKRSAWASRERRPLARPSRERWPLAWTTAQPPPLCWTEAPPASGDARVRWTPDQVLRARCDGGEGAPFWSCASKTCSPHPASATLFASTQPIRPSAPPRERSRARCTLYSLPGTLAVAHCTCRRRRHRAASGTSVAI